MRLAPLAVTLCLATAANAGVQEALDQHILPGFAQFARTTEDLSQMAAQDCRAVALRPAYHTAFDAWMTVGDLRLGPSETGALSIAFWPDPRGFTERTLSRLIAEEDPIAMRQTITLRYPSPRGGCLRSTCCSMIPRSRIMTKTVTAARSSPPSPPI